MSVVDLKGALRGELIQPGDANYDDARKLYNAMIDKKPRLIAKCVDAADVMACVNYARTNKLSWRSEAVVTTGPVSAGAMTGSSLIFAHAGRPRRPCR